ncbi:sensor histidine kinase [Solimicrobium silvestre]|uniref:histidine kinase n=1 Tax=Solimicrobium silvestre TaxID=2099400 RepID=A0A2S9GXZ1_9BURK|nr:PAS domain-containing sensor histidine kinase [Solimicrobium silvestre]PRC92583.1 PAS domain S-box protein [Solimicrobium silvestre]
MKKVHKDAEPDLSRSTQLLASALEWSHTGAWDIDLVDKTANRTREHDLIFGYDALLPEWTYDMFIEHVLPEDRADVNCLFQKAIEEQTVWRFECRIRRADGVVRWIFAAGGHQCAPDGVMRRMAGIVQDITERKQAEMAIHTLNATLERRVAERTAELEATLESLRLSQQELARSETKAMLSMLVASVSHELNSPIGNSVLAATMLSTLTQKMRESIENGNIKRSDLNTMLVDIETGTSLIERNLKRAEDLLNSLRQVAADQASEQRRKFDLAHTIKEIIDTLSPSLKRQKHRIEMNIPDGIMMDSEPGPLGQIVINIINNAYLHAFENRTDCVLTIDADIVDDWVTLRFADNGVGIPDENLKKLFQIFYSTKIGNGGTGLGMAIVQNLVTKTLGGDIAVQSNVGVGTRFDIRLPMVLPEATSKVQ